MQEITRTSAYKQALNSLGKTGVAVVFITAKSCPVCAKVEKLLLPYASDTVKLYKVDIDKADVPTSADPREIEENIIDYIGLTFNVPHIQIYRNQQRKPTIQREMFGLGVIQRDLKAAIQEATAAAKASK